MANVGSGPAGKTLIGQGTGAGPKYADIGEDSGLTDHGIVVAQGTDGFVATSPGSSNQVLTSNGAAADPSFKDVSASGAITRIVVNSGGSQTPVNGEFSILGTGSTTSIGSANSATVQLTGLTNHAVLVGAGTATITKVGPTATAGQVLQSAGASADPAFSTATYPSTAGTTGTILRSNGTNLVNTTATYPTTTTINRILYSSATNTISEIASAASSMLVTDASSVPTISSSLSGDFTFTTSTAGGSRRTTVTNTDNTNSSSDALQIISTGGTSAGDPFNRWAIGSTRSYAAGIDNSDTQAFKINTLNSATAGMSSGTNMMRIDNAGNRTLPGNAMCQAYVDVTLADVTGDGTAYTIIFDNTIFDIGSNFNTTTGTFTTPVAGKYFISASITLAGLLVTHTTCLLRIDSTTNINSTFNPFVFADAAGQATYCISGIVSVAASTALNILVQVSGGTKVVDILQDNNGPYSTFNIGLIS